ncbi:thermonuclease family protein [Hyphomicrobium sp. CS1GBMeth3]|uniref:thermonuclease family protein n=1 Tax=Hyphomicrobium sp. CS1GBMeth3 TaxID=1892845 RepID=UPI0009FB5844|nr:thermonuclease family protein [Hyphomicrobium sp. CS1GBMeth3]
MLWWRKRNEGFEWRDYVRTTILVRREQRRQRIKDVQAAAAAHVKDAGRRGLDAGLAGARSAGSGLESGARGAWSAFKRGSAAAGAGSLRVARAAGSGFLVAGSAIMAALSAGGQRLGAPLGPVLEPLLSWAREPRPNLILKAVAVLTGLGAIYRTFMFGFDGDAIVAALVSLITGAIVVLAALTDPYRGPSHAGEGLLGRLRAYELVLPGERRLPAVLALAGVVAIFAIGSALYHYSPSVTVASLAPQPVVTGALPDDADAATVEGRATALTGDMLRIGRTRVVLDGIEAPEATQICRRKSGTWRCGAAAKDALSGLVRGRRVSCDILGEEGAVKRVRCYAGETDIAEALVRGGHAFASGGFWSAYASVENEAQTQKAGLWAGEAERPQDYRDRRWEEAKKAAPEGCPIKGSIRSGARQYILPWAERYDSIGLRTSRGERWFCSESEAQSAGWSRSSSS